MTISVKKTAVAIAALTTTATIALWAGSAAAQTAAQVEAGRAAYVTNCQTCHTDNLSGSGEAVRLAGPGFMAGFGDKTAANLFTTLKSEMPLGAAGSLSDETYTDITAFILHANGAKAGAALTPASAVKISSVANGTVPPDVANGIKLAQAAPGGGRGGRGAAAAGDGAAPAGGGDGAGPGGPPRRQLLDEKGNPMGGPTSGAYGGFKVDTRLGITHPGTVPNFAPVTDAMMDNPSPNDWLMYRGNYAGWSYSKLDQINTSNVSQLQLKWSLAMSDAGANETTPIIHDGVMYVVSAGNTVQAINAVTGDVIWMNVIGPIPKSEDPGGDDATRAIGIYNDKIILPSIQGKLYALDARTGKMVWQTWITDPANPDEGQHSNTGGVIIAHGKAIVGMAGCGRVPQTKHCYISAYDANTGKRLWKFYTVADTGQPGGDSWGKLPNDQRAGAETWTAGTFDPVSNTTFWGTAQAKPWRRDLRGSGDGATNYANSTLALDADTGKLKWFFSHAPGESFDLDDVFERILIDHGNQKTVMATGKNGILWKLDRNTGKYLDSRQTVFQNIYTKIDPKTGVPTYRKDIINQKLSDWLASCPGPEGGKNWPAASYDPSADRMIIPLSQSCVEMLGSGTEKYMEMPGTEGNMGRLSAYQTDTMKPLWSLQQRAPFLTGVVSTAGNVAFVGDFDRVFHAFDTRTGKQLWTTRLPTTVQGHVAPFMVNGKEYIAVMTGLGGGSPEQKPTFMLSEETFRPGHGTGVFVFALPDNK